MKIGLFSDSYLPATDGISYSIESYRQELVRLGHEVYVFAPSPSIRYKERSEGIIRFPAVKGLFYDDYMTSMFFPPQAMQKIKKLDLDVIHFHTPSQVGLLGAYYAMRRHLPLVVTYHTDLYEYVSHYPGVLPGSIALSLLSPIITGGRLADYRQAVSSVRPTRNIDAWNKKIVKHGITQLHNRCDIVIAPSRKVQQQLEGWGATSPIKVLPTGVDTITTKAAEITAFRTNYNIHKNDQVVTFVGRLGSEKNIEMLIRAFALLVPKHPSAKLLIVGDNVHRPVLEEYAKTQGIVDKTIFTGYIEHDQLGAAYGASTVFAFPSRTDTQGLVLHEATNAGLPVVMVDGDITEVVEDSRNGYICKNNAKDMAKRLATILDDEELRASMSLHSKKLAKQYSVAHQTKKLVSLYKSAIEAHKKADAIMPPREPIEMPNPFPFNTGRK